MQGGERIVVGISGASGTIYGIRALELLREAGKEVHLVISPAAQQTMRLETDYAVDAVKALADVVHPPRDLGASISSGSFATLGMLVAPCAIRSLSEIAYGNTSSLLTRAADVCLKERRRVVLLVRETPLHAGHLRAMQQATENGAVVMPPVPAFYSRPSSIDDMVTQTVSRALDLFGIDTGRLRRWSGHDDGETE
jgi:4-hydroxy-3-polyprenylbenzoate decarboxylase